MSRWIADSSHPPRHILYLRSDAIGDAILGAAMLPPLRRAFPTARINVACDTRVAPLYEHCPLIDGVLAFEKSRLFNDAALRIQTVRQVRALACDLCLHPVYSRDPVGDFLAINSGAEHRVTHAGE